MGGAGPGRDTAGGGGVILRLSYKQCAAGGIEMDSEPGCHNVQSESRANLGFPGGSI